MGIDMLSRTKITLTLGTLAALVVPAHAVVVIDDFSTGDVSAGINSGMGYFFQNGSMVGGDRLAFLQVTGNPFGLNVDVDVTTGTLSFSKESGVDGIGQVRYGFMPSGDNSAFEDLNLDLSGESAFKVTVLNNDLAGLLRLRVRSSTQNSGMYMISTQNIGVINSSTDVYFDFNSFSGFDFSDVDQIVLEFNTPAGGDITIDTFEAVPEPATLALLGAGALAISRRRKQASK